MKYLLECIFHANVYNVISNINYIYIYISLKSSGSRIKFYKDVPLIIHSLKRNDIKVGLASRTGAISWYININILFKPK